MQHLIVGIGGEVSELTKCDSCVDPHYKIRVGQKDEKALQLFLGSETINKKKYDLWQLIILSDDSSKDAFLSMRTKAAVSDSVIGPWSYAHFAELYPELAKKYLEDEGKLLQTRIVAGEDASDVWAYDFRPD
jgi:hypothetical protein